MPDPLSAADIADGRRLNSLATSGPWETYVSRTEVLPGRETREIVRPNGDLHPWNVLKVGNQCCWPPTTADAELIAWARNHLPALLDAAEALGTARQLIDDLTDPDDCSFDHHGGCQAHGYLSLEPGELCPVEGAKQWLAAHPTEEGAR